MPGLILKEVSVFEYKPATWGPCSLKETGLGGRGRPYIIKWS